MKHLRILGVASVCAIILSLGIVQPTNAATTTSSASIAATIANTCSIGTVTSPSAPTLTGGVAPAEISGSFPLTCTSGDSTTIAMSVGAHGSGAGTASPTRAVANGTNTLAYSLYQASGSTLWGDMSGTNTKAVTGTGAAITENFYVDFATPALTLPAGSYTDTVTITVTY